MKLKKFNQLFEREGFDFDGYDDDYDDDYSRDKEYKGEDENEYDDDMSHLCYLLRSMFGNSNIDVSVDNSGLDLSITAKFDKKEHLGDIIKLFEVVKKIKKDILAQYSSYYQIWEDKMGYPIITFDFNLDEDGDKDGVYTDDKDDAPWN
jgi:hypothetical protein